MLDCPRKASGYFTKSMTRLHLPHAIIVRLHGYLSEVVILTPETADMVGVLSSSLSLSVGFSFQDEVMGAARTATQDVRKLFKEAYFRASGRVFWEKIIISNKVPCSSNS